MDPDALRAWRTEQRAALAAARAAIEHDERARASAAIDAGLDALIAAEPSAVVGLYWPIRGEFDPAPFASRLRAAGITPALPVVVGKAQPLEFRAWEAHTPLVRGGFGLTEPAAGPAVEPGVLVIPLLGFDAAGYRLGYGAGYYDMTLAALERKPFTIGVGFACARLPTIHPQPHDVPMDAIVTERGIVRIPPPG